MDTGKKSQMVTVTGVGIKGTKTIEVSKNLIFEELGEKFAWTKDYKHFLEFTHLRTGTGFNGAWGENRTDSFYYGVERAGGRERFKEIVEALPDLKVMEKKANEHIELKKARLETYLELRDRMEGCLRIDLVTSLLSDYVVVDVKKTLKVIESRFKDSEENKGEVLAHEFMEKRWGKDVVDKFISLF